MWKPAFLTSSHIIGTQLNFRLGGKQETIPYQYTEVITSNALCMIIASHHMSMLVGIEISIGNVFFSSVHYIESNGKKLHQLTITLNAYIPTYT